MVGVLLVAGAYYQASGLSQLAASALGSETSPHAVPPQPLTAGVVPPFSFPARDEHVTSARPILDRNPFESGSPRPLDGPQSVPPGGPSPGELCPGVKAVIAVAAYDASQSVAVLSNAPHRRPHLVRIDEPFEGKTVESIEWNRVVLSTAASRCELRMFMIGVPAGLEPPSAVAASSAELASKVERLSAAEFSVEREMVDRVLMNPAEWMKMARVVPDFDNGKPVIRLYGIRPDSVLGVLGIENGDRLHTLNGLDLTNPQESLEAYTRLRSEHHLILRLERRGRIVDLDYEIK